MPVIRHKKIQSHQKTSQNHEKMIKCTCTFVYAYVHVHVHRTGIQTGVVTHQSSNDLSPLLTDACDVRRGLTACKWQELNRIEWFALIFTLRVLTMMNF